MPREPLALGLTFALACVSACLFLMLRCEGKGRMFGPRSRWWASSVIVLTSVLSTVAAYITVTAAITFRRPFSVWVFSSPVRCGSARYARAAPSAGTCTGTPGRCG